MLQFGSCSGDCIDLGIEPPSHERMSRKMPAAQNKEGRILMNIK